VVPGLSQKGNQKLGKGRGRAALQLEAPGGAQGAARGEITVDCHSQRTPAPDRDITAVTADPFLRQTNGAKSPSFFVVGPDERTGGLIHLKGVSLPKLPIPRRRLCYGSKGCLYVRKVCGSSARSWHQNAYPCNRPCHNVPLNPDAAQK